MLKIKCTCARCMYFCMYTSDPADNRLNHWFLLDCNREWYPCQDFCMKEVKVYSQSHIICKVTLKYAGRHDWKNNLFEIIRTSITTYVFNLRRRAHSCTFLHYQLRTRHFIYSNPCRVFALSGYWHGFCLRTIPKSSPRRRNRSRYESLSARYNTWRWPHCPPSWSSIYSAIYATSIWKHNGIRSKFRRGRISL